MPENTDHLSGAEDPVLELLQAHQEQITRVTGTVEQHEETLQWVLEELGDETTHRGTPVAWSWRHVTGEQRTALWNELREFVAWVNARYFSREYTQGIAPCWYQHPRAVEELTAMWAAWHAAYHDHKQPTVDAAEWHTRTLWPVVERLTGEFRDCLREQDHVIVQGRDWTTSEGFDEFVDDDVRHHPDQEA